MTVGYLLASCYVDGGVNSARRSDKTQKSQEHQYCSIEMFSFDENNHILNGGYELKADTYFD